MDFLYLKYKEPRYVALIYYHVEFLQKVSLNLKKQKLSY